MLYLSADSIFDGYQFRPSNEVLAIQEDGAILGFFEQTHSMSIQHHPGIIVPGFINAHCHLELSYLKNSIQEGSMLVNFLIGINEQYRKPYSSKLIEKAILEADSEMYRNGIVAVGDISNTLHSLLCKKSSSIYYHTFVECMGLVETNSEQRFHTSLDILKKFKDIGNASLVLHAPYSVSNRLVELVKNQSTNTIQSIHMQECEAENELYEKGTGEFHRLFEYILGSSYPWHRIGISSLEYFLNNSKGKHTILVHNTAVKLKDIEYAISSKKSISYCLCPKANLYIENKLPPVNELLQSNIPIIIGTDSLAANTSLNLLEEVNVLQKAFPKIPLAYWLQSITIHGAKALAIDTTFGSFEEGKKPGILLIKEKDGLLNPQSIQRIY